LHATSPYLFSDYTPLLSSCGCAGHRRDGRSHRDGEADDEDEDDLEYEAHAGGDAMDELDL
jgi:hypothetical protein